MRETQVSPNQFDQFLVGVVLLRLFGSFGLVGQRVSFDWCFRELLVSNAPQQNQAHSQSPHCLQGPQSLPSNPSELDLGSRLAFLEQ